MMKKYRYEISGTGGGGEAFSASGEVDVDGGMFAAVAEAQRSAYAQLTGGRTEYGKPGVGGCKGPYQMSRVVVEVVEQKGAAV